MATKYRYMCFACGEYDRSYSRKSDLTRAINCKKLCLSCSRKRYKCRRILENANCKIFVSTKDVEYCRSCSSYKTNNGNYNKGYYYWWIQKYGKEAADKMNAVCSLLKRNVGPNNGMYGRTHNEKTIAKILENRPITPEVREKMRKSALKRIIRTSGGPSYNPKSIPILEEFAKKNNLNIQHAENGGEYTVAGYSVDAIDIDKNIVIEYDEPHHYFGGLLREQDFIRQQRIIDELNCTFIRLKYDGSIFITGKRIDSFTF